MPIKRSRRERQKVTPDQLRAAQKTQRKPNGSTPPNGVLHATQFFSASASKKRAVSFDDLDALVSTLTDAPVKPKARLPWIKLAEFGDERTGKGALRHDANVTTLFGVEGDYDGEQMSIEAAVEALQGEIEAIVYASPSHTPDKPRWRVLAFLSEPYEGTVEQMKAHRTQQLRKIEAVLGVKFSGESFTLSQSYFYGTTPDTAQHYAVHRTDGPKVDKSDNVSTNVETLSPVDLGAFQQAADSHSPLNVEKLTRTVATKGEGVHQSNRDLAAHYAATGMSEQDIVSTLQGLMGEPTDERERKRYDDIPRLVRSAVEKYAPVEQPQELPQVAAPPVSILHLPPRRPVIGNRLLQGHAFAVVGNPGGGKTQFALQTAVGVALNRTELTGETIWRHGNALVLSNEEPAEELFRRLAGICTHYQLDFAEVCTKVTIVSGYGTGGLKLAAPSGRAVAILDQSVDHLVSLMRDRQILYAALDPLISLHGCEENDNTAIETMMNAVRQIAERTDAAVELLHHTSKASGKDTQADDVFAGRGASALAGAIRGQVNMGRLSKDDAKEAKLTDEERRRVIWWSTSKANYTPLAALNWCRMESVRLANGDNVGVLVPVDDFMASLNERKVEAKAEAETAKQNTVLMAAVDAFEPGETRLTRTEVATRISSALHKVKGDGYSIRALQNALALTIDKAGASEGLKFEREGTRIMVVLQR